MDSLERLILTGASWCCLVEERWWRTPGREMQKGHRALRWYQTRSDVIDGYCPRLPMAFSYVYQHPSLPQTSSHKKPCRHHPSLHAASTPFSLSVGSGIVRIVRVVRLIKEGAYSKVSLAHREVDVIRSGMDSPRKGPASIGDEIGKSGAGVE